MCIVVSPLFECCRKMRELHLAAYTGNVERVQELLEASGDPNEYNEPGYPLSPATLRDPPWESSA
jgi:hypothetical protein